MDLQPFVHVPKRAIRINTKFAGIKPEQIFHMEMYASRFMSESNIYYFLRAFFSAIAARAANLAAQSNTA